MDNISITDFNLDVYGSNTDDESEYDRDFYKACVRMALHEELTDVQRQYMLELIAGLTVSDIADIHGVDQSTVTRTLQRAFDNLRHVLKYTSPRLLHAKPEHYSLSKIKQILHG